jgi:hypothetical protein
MKSTSSRFKYLTVVFLLAFLIVSCLRKDETMGDAGQTLVKLYPGVYSKVVLAPLATSQTIALLEIRRDLAGPAALNSSTSVVLKFDKDAAMVNKYNDANNTYFTLLPNNLYTSDPAPAADGTVTLNFGAGDFVKSVMITVPNVFKFDFSEKYALAYKLVSVSGNGIKSQSAPDTTVIEIGAQNAYEGWYHSVGFRSHPTAGIYDVDDDKYLSTIDQYTVETYTGDYTPYRLWITINPNGPSSGNVTVMSPDVVLFNNTPAVNARGITGGNNRYDAATKTYYLYYYYNAAAPRVIQETITKK